MNEQSFVKEDEINHCKIVQNFMHIITNMFTKEDEFVSTGIISSFSTNLKL